MKKFIIITLSLLIVVLAGIGFFIYSIFSGPGENIPLVFGDKKELKSSSGRTNILAVGVDTRDGEYFQTGTLTDTLMIISVDPIKKDVNFLSLPRDLWVEVEGQGMKINEVFAIKGLDSLKSTIENYLGVEVHYVAKADFNSVIDIVDSVEGVTINNPVAFTDHYYPKAGWENETCGVDVEELKNQREEEWEEENKDNEDAIKPSTFISQHDFPCRFETISFSKGEITLSGDEALKYARSRHSIDGGQGSDFARAKRQQLIMLGVKDKILTTDTLTNINKVREIYSNLSKSLETDFTINELITAIPYIKESKEYSIESKVLSNSSDYDSGGVLVQGAYENYGGRYVLIPKELDLLKTFVNEYFYGSLDSQ